MIEWLESAKRISAESGQDISDYRLVLGKFVPAGVELECKVDHGSDTVWLCWS